MENVFRIFPYGKTISGVRNLFEHGPILMDSSAGRARRKAAVLSPSVTMVAAFMGSRVFPSFTGDPSSLLTFQTQATQTVLQSREGLVMPRMAMLLGLMGIGMSGYSSRQLTLHYKPSANLMR